MTPPTFLGVFENKGLLLFDKIVGVLISPSANVWLNKTGQSKSESHDDKIPREEPELFLSIFAALKSELGISFDSVANSLNITTSMLSTITGIAFYDDDSSFNTDPLFGSI